MIEQIKGKNRTRFVTSSFRGKFLREPSPAELTHWLAVFQADADFQQFLNQISQAAASDQPFLEMLGKTTEIAVQTVDLNAKASDEANSCNIDDLQQLPDDAFVEAIYQRFLDRRADADGKSFFCNHLATGGERLQTALDLANSAEGQHYRLIATTAKNDLTNKEGANHSFPAKVFVRRFHALVEIN